MTPATRRRLTIAALAGAALGGLAIANALEARRARRAHPPVGRFVEVDGVRLHVVEQGEGAPVLLVHGNGVWLDDWRISGLIDKLAETHRVIAVDRPGFGWSSRPRGIRWTVERQAALLDALLAQLGLSEVVVVGQSFGATVAAAMALNHPERLKGAALIGGFYYPEPRGDVLLVAGSAVPGLGDVLNHTLQPLLAEALRGPVHRLMFGPAPTPDAWAEQFSWGMALRPSRMRAGAADAIHLLTGTAALAPRWGEIRLPISLIAGTGDRVVDYALHSVKLHEQLPNARLTLFDDVGHMAHYTRMQEIAAAVRLL